MLWRRSCSFWSRANLKLAQLTIATNESYKKIQIERGGRKPETIFVVRNGPNRDRMRIPAA